MRANGRTGVEVGPALARLGRRRGLRLVFIGDSAGVVTHPASAPLLKQTTNLLASF